MRANPKWARDEFRGSIISRECVQPNRRCTVFTFHWKWPINCDLYLPWTIDSLFPTHLISWPEQLDSNVIIRDHSRSFEIIRDHSRSGMKPTWTTRETLVLSPDNHECTNEVQLHTHFEQTKRLRRTRKQSSSLNTVCVGGQKRMNGRPAGSLNRIL